MMRIDGLILLLIAGALLIGAFSTERHEPPRWAGCHASVLPECAGRSPR